jgi:hypothetical protein
MTRHFSRPRASNGAAAYDWQVGLLRGDRGVRPILANAIAILRKAPQWAGVLAFNEFALSVTHGDGWYYPRGSTTGR